MREINVTLSCRTTVQYIIKEPSTTRCIVSLSNDIIELIKFLIKWERKLFLIYSKYITSFYEG